MKFGRKLTLAAGTTVTAALVVAASYGVGVAAYHANFSAPFKSPYTKGHATAAAEVVNSGQCSKCHRTSIPGSALRGGRSAHQQHVASIFLTFGRTTRDASGADVGVKTGCILCHPDTNTSNYLRVSGASKNAPMSLEGDVSYTGAAPDTSQRLRKHVNPAFCARCHGKSKTDGTHGGVVPTGCKASACHGTSGMDPTAAHDDTPWIKSVSVASSSDARCLLCHGAKAWYQDQETNAPGIDPDTDYNP